MLKLKVVEAIKFTRLEFKVFPSRKKLHTRKENDKKCQKDQLLKY